MTPRRPGRLPSRLDWIAGLLLAVCFWIGMGGSAEAKGSPAPPPPPDLDSVLSAFPNGMTDAQLDAVLGVMSDTTLREGLRKRLLAEMAARSEAASSEGEGILKVYARRLRALPAAYAGLPARLEAAFSRGGEISGVTGATRWIGAIALILAVGIIGMLAVRALLAPVRRYIREQAVAGSKVAIGALVFRLILDLVEIAAFLAASALTYAIFEPTHPAAPRVLMILLQAVAVVMLVSRLVLFFCDTEHGGMRLLTVDDMAARALHRVVFMTTLLTVGVTAVLRALMALGLDPDSLVALALPLSLLPFVYLIALAWLNRTALAGRARHWLTLDGGRRVLLDAWPVLLTVYLSILWMVLADGILRQQPGVAPRALESLLLMLAVPLLAWLIHRPLARFYGVAVLTLGPAPGAPANPGNAPGAAAASGMESSALRQVQRLMRAVWFVLIVGAIVLTSRIWGFDPSVELGIGSYIIRFLFDIGVVLLLGYVGWALILRSIERALESAKAGGGTTRAQRMATLLPLLRKFLQVSLALMIAMVILASMGVEIGPLLAGAGVVGIAIGLGAQQTIADILAGIFFLLEDSFRIGDYVEVGNLRGDVESISLRSMKLRHQRGAVHTLPFGQMKSLTNYSRDWALMRLEFRVTPDTDIGLVKKLVKKIGKELLEDPELGPGFIDPLKSQGIRNVEDGALVIGIKYIAKPNAQFVIRRVAYEKLINAFRENGIKLVGRGVVVRVEGGDRVPPEAVGAAAAQAIEKDSEHA
jgi:moderate conductance mechanosensitive channel